MSIDDNLIPCTACGEDFEGSEHQCRRHAGGYPVYCSDVCTSRRTTYKQATKNQPWAWLDVKHIVDVLPKDSIEEPFVGY